MLKSQDILVLLHLATLQGKLWTYYDIHSSLLLSASEAHAAFTRAAMAGLYEWNSKKPKGHALAEFCTHGLKYVFPTSIGGPTIGIGTCSGSNFKFPFNFDKSEVPVWPNPNGLIRGFAIEPLYKTVPSIVSNHQELYYLLVLIDFIRIGRTRERQWAAETLSGLLEKGGIYGI